MLSCYNGHIEYNRAGEKMAHQSPAYLVLELKCKVAYQNQSSSAKRAIPSCTYGSSYAKYAAQVQPVESYGLRYKN